MTVKMAGGIDRFVSLLKDGSLEAQEYALWLLWQSTDQASKRSIAMARAARPIVAILVSDNLSGVAKEHAASVLASMTSAELASVDEGTRAANKQDIVEEGGVVPLVNLLRTGSVGAKRHAAAALAQLCRGAEGALPETQLAIMEAGAIAPIVEWLDQPAGGPIRAMAARALAELSTENQATQNVIVQAKAVKPLVAMMVDGAPDEQKWAASAVAALSADNSASQVEIANAGGIPPLVELLKREASGPHEHATRAIWHLASTRENKAAIATEGCLPPLVALLADALPIALPAPRRETTTARRPPSDDFVDALAPHLSPDADLGAGGEVGATEAEALRRGLRERGWASFPSLVGAETASAAREEARELARQSALPRSLRSFAALRGPLWRAMEGATRADRHVEIWPQPTRLPALTEAMLDLRRLVGHAAPDLPDGSSLTFQLATFAGDGGRLQYHRDDCDGGADGAEPTAEACAADAAAGNGTAECAQRAALCWYADASQYGPGRRPRRLLTALWYLNVGWHDGDGGDLRLRAADGEVSLPPRGDEAVLFNASVPHDVAPSHAERWALTMWVHDAQ